MLMPGIILEKEFVEFEPLIKERFKTVRSLNRGETLLRPGDARKDCYYVLKGMFSYTLKHEHGGTQTSSMRGKGTIFPLYYSYPRTNVESGLEVSALEDSLIIIMPKPEFQQLMMENPAIAVTMCDVYGKYSTLLLNGISSILFDSSFVRVCDFLLTQSQAYGNSISLSHEDIGNITGVTRATVSRVVSELRQKEIIATNRRSIIVTSPEKLRPYCSYIVSVKQDS